eukprot:UN5152
MGVCSLLWPPRLSPFCFRLVFCGELGGGYNFPPGTALALVSPSAPFTPPKGDKKGGFPPGGAPFEIGGFLGPGCPSKAGPPFIFPWGGAVPPPPWVWAPSPGGGGSLPPRARSPGNLGGGPGGGPPRLFSPGPPPGRGGPVFSRPPPPRGNSRGVGCFGGP